jgi:leader peptidase (prepilin peptidase)/N-methyltransferase
MIGLYVYIFVIGLVLGSFYNVVGLRIPAGQSIVKPRSACPSCSHTLTARELIPVFSYVGQRGRCSRCSARISPIYPFFEFFTGILFVFAFYQMGWDAETVVGWTLISLLMIIVVSDVSYMLIPNKILLFFLIVFLIERMLVPLQPWWQSITGALLGFILLFLIAVISKGGMGGGDVKLFGLLGLVLGDKLIILAFLLSCFFGTVFGFVGLLTGHVERGKPMPFGPFIALGALTAYFFGNHLIQYYVSLLYKW